MFENAFKLINFKYTALDKMFYVSLIVTRKQKSTVVTQKTKSKEYKHTATEKPPQRKRATEERNYQSENNEQMSKSPYLSIIVLNINGLNSLIKRHRVIGLKKKEDLSLWCL